MTGPDRLETLPAMLCVGIRRTHSYADAAAGIAAQWREFDALEPIAGARGSARYGIQCGADADGFEYMCAAEVSSFDDAPAGLGRIRIPAQQYAVFEHPGDASTLARAWLGIWQEWIPRSGYAIAHTPEFERYANGIATKQGIEIWASIRKEAVT